MEGIEYQLREIDKSLVGILQALKRIAEAQEKKD